MPSASEVDHAEANALAQHLANVREQLRIDRISGSLLAIYLLAVINGCRYFQGKGPQLQTISISLNHWLLGFVLLIPVIVLCLRLSASYTRSAGCITVILLLIMLPLDWMLLGHFMMEPREQLQSIRVGNQSIGCFRTLGGGVDSYAVEIRQERRIAPGLIWSTFVDREDFTKDVTATLPDNHHLKCKFFTHEKFISESLPGTRTVVLQIR